MQKKVRDLQGLKKKLEFQLAQGQVAFKFCLWWASLRFGNLMI